MSMRSGFASSSRDALDTPDETTAVDLSRAIVAAVTSRSGDQSIAADATNDRLEEDDAKSDIDEEEESCLICLGSILDRTVLPKCLHSLFCFDCILKWIGIHRRCPLCSTSIDDYIIHSIRSDADYIRHYLPTAVDTSSKGDGDIQIDPLRLQADLSQSEARRIRRQLQQRVVSRDVTGRQSRSLHPDGRRPSSTVCESNFRNIEWGERRVEERQRDAIANWDDRLAFRRRVYREQLYCLHTGSNRSSKLVSPPSHSTIAASKTIESMLLNFIRRELLAYPLTNDVDFLSRYTINVLKTFDCKSNEAVNLIAEFLGIQGAEHFCHEIYSFSRFVGEGGIQATSGRYRDKVKAFDEWAQYKKRGTERRRSGEEHSDSLDRRRNVAEGYEDVRQPLESTAEKPEQVVEDDMTALRSTIRQGREKLLEKLEAERRTIQGTPSFSPVVTEELSKGTDGVDRERELKLKLSLKRREAELKMRAVQARAKRQKRIIK